MGKSLKISYKTQKFFIWTKETPATKQHFLRLVAGVPTDIHLMWAAL